MKSLVESFTALAVVVATLFIAANCLEIITTVEPSCKVITDQGNVDLSPVAGTTKAHYLKSTGGAIFYWNPCNNINVVGNGNCDSVQVCQLFDGKFTTDMGEKKDSQFLADEDKLILKYNHNDYTITIHLVCGTADDDDFDLESKPMVYHWTLTSKHACIVKTTPSASTLSAGTIIIIVLLAVTVSYVIVGALYGKLVKKASGEDLCPNHLLWSYLLINIKVPIFMGAPDAPPVCV